MLGVFKKKPSSLRLMQGIAAPGTLREGKWIVANQSVGILNNISGFPVVEVHFTDAKGETIGVAQTHMDQIRIAKYLEIPEPRRPTDYAYAAAVLGYV